MTSLFCIFVNIYIYIFKECCSFTVTGHPKQQGTSDHSCLVSPPGVLPLSVSATASSAARERKEGRECYPAEMAAAATSPVPSSFLITRWKFFKGKFTEKVEVKQNKAPSARNNHKEADMFPENSSFNSWTLCTEWHCWLWPGPNKSHFHVCPRFFLIKLHTP